VLWIAVQREFNENPALHTAHAQSNDGQISEWFIPMVTLI